MKHVRAMACVLSLVALLASQVPARSPHQRADRHGESRVLTATSDSLYHAHHPRLLFDRSELPGLYQKVRDGGPDDDAYDFIRHLVDSVYPTQTELELLAPAFGIDLPLKLGLAAYLETPPDTAALALGRRMTLFVADNFDPDDDVFFSPIRMLILAFGYDMFFGQGQQAERTYVRNELNAYIDTAMTVFNYERWLHNPYVSNKSAMVGAALGLAAICLEHETDPARVDAIVARADEFVAAWSGAHLDPGGAYNEGAMYAGWSMRHLIYYFWARKRYYDNYDFSQRSDIRNLEKWVAYEVLPLGGAMLNNINDTATLNFPLSRHHTYFDWAQSEWGSTLSAWIWERLVGPVYGYEWGVEADKAATVLWNQNLSPQQPDDLLSKHTLWEHRGLYYFRTGWQQEASSDDVLFSFYSGKFQGGHAHEDQNNFTLYGYGEAFAVDNGYLRPAQESEAHNMVFVDGLGQHYAGGSIGTDGKIVEYLLSDFTDYLLGDATAAYTTYSEFNRTGHPFPDDDWSAGFDGGNPVNFALRRILVVHEEPIPPYIIMLDDIEKDQVPHVYQWRMHTPTTNTVNISENPIRIVGERGFLDLHVLSPPFESLAVDTIAFDNPNEDPNTIILSLSLEATSPHFAFLMMPANKFTLQPAVIRQDFPWGQALRLAWSGSDQDLFLLNRSGGAVTYVLEPDGAGIPVMTDARLTLVRMNDRQMTSYLLSNGSTFDFAGIPHVRVTGAKLNCARSGATFDIDNADAEFSFYAPDGGQVRYRGNEVSVLNDGGFLKPDPSAGGSQPQRTTSPLNLSAYPNPFNPITNFLVDLESRGSVTVVVFDVKGRFVRTVWNGVLPEGRNLVRWDGTNGDGHPVATGVYFARAVGTGVVKTIKITLLR